jgi:hypothetical protein
MLEELCFQQYKAKTERCYTYARLSESVEGSLISERDGLLEPVSPVHSDDGERKAKKNI